MSEISAIIFDVGGVLLTNGWDTTGRDAVLQQFGLDRGAFEERHPEANDEWEKGLITAEDYLARTVFYERRDFSPADFLAAMKGQSALLPAGAIGILSSIAASEQSGQWLLATLNNEARELNDYRLDHFGLRPLFKLFLSSCYVALRKPDSRIYKMALDVLQRQPGEVIFIDDREINVKPAAALGIRAIQFKSVEQLESDLVELGVTVQRKT